MWMYYAVILTATGGITTSTIPFADMQACMGFKNQFAQLSARVQTDPKISMIATCIPLSQDEGLRATQQPGMK
jgi:hypothetical protein